MVVLRKFNSPCLYLEDKSIMLSFQCCPTCHQEFSVPSNQQKLTNNTIKITTNNKSNNTTNSMQIDIDINPIHQISNINIIPIQNHCCNISNGTTTHTQYPSSSESLSGINEKALDNSYTLRNKTAQYVAPVISNRLSLCGGGLVSINTDSEPIESLTPSMILNNNNPFDFSKQEFDAVNFDTETDESYYEEMMSTDKLQEEEDEIMNCSSYPPYSRESSVSSLSSQMSPNIPLSFVLPLPKTSSANNSRPLSLQLDNMVGNRRIESMSRPLSMNLSTNNPRRNTQNLSIQQLRTPINNNHMIQGDARSLWQNSLPLEYNNQDIKLFSQLQNLVPQSPESELVALSRLEKRLDMCNWYYGDLTWQRSEDVLKSSAPGTFFIRNSSASKHLYSLSVQTTNGPTNIRLCYLNGLFSLNSDDTMQQFMPQFNCVIGLIEYYVNFTLMQGKRAKNRSNGQIGNGEADKKYFRDSTGNIHSEISLIKPLYNEVPSLKHFSRMKIHQAIKTNGQPKLPLLPGYSLLDLPKCLVEYLAEYPYGR